MSDTNAAPAGTPMHLWIVGIVSLLLLLRKKFAVSIFATSFVALLATMIHNYGFSNGMEVMGSASSLAFTAAIFVFALFLIIYSRKMCSRGVLR